MSVGSSSLGQQAHKEAQTVTKRGDKIRRHSSTCVVRYVESVPECYRIRVKNRRWGNMGKSFAVSIMFCYIGYVDKKANQSNGPNIQTLN